MLDLGFIFLAILITVCMIIFKNHKQAIESSLSDLKTKITGFESKLDKIIKDVLPK